MKKTFTLTALALILSFSTYIPSLGVSETEVVESGFSELNGMYAISLDKAPAKIRFIRHQARTWQLDEKAVISLIKSKLIKQSEYHFEQAKKNHVAYKTRRKIIRWSLFLAGVGALAKIYYSWYRPAHIAYNVHWKAIEGIGVQLKIDERNGWEMLYYRIPEYLNKNTAQSFINAMTKEYKSRYNATGAASTIFLATLTSCFALPTYFYPDHKERHETLTEIIELLD